MRCKACNTSMTEKELDRTQPDGSQEDMCTFCLIKSGVYIPEEDFIFDDVIISEKDLEE